MEGLPSDIFDHDVKSFPTQDSAMAKKLEAQIKRADEQEERDQQKKQRGRPAGTKPTAKPKVELPAPDKHRSGTIANKTQKIRLYFNYLSHKITFAEPKVYPTTHLGLDEVLDKIECQLHGEGGIEKAGVMYQASAVGLERLMTVFNPMGWNLTGPAVSLSQAVAANEDKWKDLVKEFAIENSTWFMFGPGKRLVATTVQLILAVDNANKAAGYQRQQAPASEDLQEEGAEL